MKKSNGSRRFVCVISYLFFPIIWWICLRSLMGLLWGYVWIFFEWNLSTLVRFSSLLSDGLFWGSFNWFSCGFWAWFSGFLFLQPFFFPLVEPIYDFSFLLLFLGFLILFFLVWGLFFFFFSWMVVCFFLPFRFISMELNWSSRLPPLSGGTKQTFWVEDLHHSMAFSLSLLETFVGFWPFFLRCFPLNLHLLSSLSFQVAPISGTFS